MYQISLQRPYYYCGNRNELPLEVRKMNNKSMNTQNNSQNYTQNGTQDSTKSKTNSKSSDCSGRDCRDAKNTKTQNMR